MTFRINVDSHQKRQRFIVTISTVRMQYFLLLAYYVRLAVLMRQDWNEMAVFLYHTNDAQKESLVGGGQNLQRGGPYPFADLDGGGGSKSAVTTAYPTAIAFVLENKEILELEFIFLFVILFRFRLWLVLNCTHSLNQGSSIQCRPNLKAWIANSTLLCSIVKHAGSG